MSFVNPSWLWALSALLVPLTIHLLSRKEGKVIPVGSLRHLKDANTQQFKSLRLNEILLFILRCLLIILVVFFISGLQKQKSTQQNWVMLEEDLKDNPQAKSLADSLIKEGFELHELSTNSSNPAIANTSYWSLSEQLQIQGISEAVIISSARASDFKGARVQRPASVQWITLPVIPKDYLIAATQKTKDSVSIRTGSLQNESTHYTSNAASVFPGQKIFKTNTDSITINSPDTITITLASDADFSYDRKIILASFYAIQKNGSAQLIIKESGTDILSKDINSNWLIWLSEKPLPESNSSVIFYHTNSSTLLLQQQSNSTWQLSKRLNEEVALNENLVVELAKIISSDKEQWKIANKKDQRTMPEEMMWSAPSGESKQGAIAFAFSPLDNVLIVLILLIWVAERMISYKRNQ